MAVRPLRLLTAFTMMVLVCAAQVCLAQTTPPTPTPGGVEIDATGVLNLKTQVDLNGILDRQLAAAARQSQSKDMQTPSALRKVSMTRLEKECAKLLEGGKPLTDDMLHMAGLTRITHVFFYPETKDVVIAGPAEGFYHNSQNTTVGLDSGNATLNLEDMVVALRTFGPKAERVSTITCSIDPTPEGLARLRQACVTIQEQFRPGAERQVLQTLQQALGMQTITVAGVAPETRMARVLVEADYQMKLIGIGLLQPNARVTSYVAGSDPAAGTQNSLQRWYFQPNYECVQVNQDRTAMQLVGNGVRLLSEDERVAGDGSRSGTGRSNKASKNFCDSFTKEYDKLSQQIPAFAELRNVMDLTIAAAYLQKAQLFQRAEWDMATFSNEELMPTKRFNAPKQVAPAINAVWKDGFFMTPIGGGVSIQPMYALNSDKVTEEANGEITAVRDSIKTDNLADGQWWWD